MGWGWLDFAHASNVVVAAVFILAFAGLGTWYVNHSNASSYGCVDQTFGQGLSNSMYGSTCVKAIQSMLDHYHYGPYSLKTGSSYDGIFGSKTYANVVRYQYQRSISSGGGQVGSRTWKWLCYDAKNTRYGDYNDFMRAGCTKWYGYGELDPAP